MHDQSSESQDHAALDAEVLDLLEQDRAIHAKLAEVAGELIAHRAAEAALAALDGRHEVAEALGVEADAE